MSGEAPGSTDGLDSLADDLAALGNAQRLRMLHLLTRPRHGEELGDALGMSRQSALKHAEKLEERGFVRALHGRRERGPVTEYEVVPQRLFALGVAIGGLGRLEPRGGPSIRKPQRTSVLEAPAGAPAPVSPSSVPTAHLLFVSGPRSGTRFELAADAGRWTIGRDADQDIPLGHDPFVSASHAELQRAPGHGLDVVDVYSANGTFVNFARLPRGGRVRLAPGDVVGAGHTFLVYQTV